MKINTYHYLLRSFCAVFLIQTFGITFMFILDKPDMLVRWVRSLIGNVQSRVPFSVRTIVLRKFNQKRRLQILGINITNRLMIHFVMLHSNPKSDNKPELIYVNVRNHIHVYLYDRSEVVTIA